MASGDRDDWSERLRRTLACYDEGLLRAVAARLVKPRNQWPAEELIERAVGAAENPAVLDRRLQEVEPAGRQLLALIAHSRQPCWHLGNLVELLLALGQDDGLRPVFHLLEAGLLFPVLGRRDEAPAGRVKNFEQWLAFPGQTGLRVFTTPLIAERAVGEDLGLPDLSGMRNAECGMRNEEAPASSIPQSAFNIPHWHEADGLEWLLRLAVLWQQVAAAPLRRTQQGGFFKRDADRLGQDALLNGPPSDRLAEVPDLGFLVEALAELEGVVRVEEAEVRAGSLPAAWEAGAGPAREARYADLPRLTGWGPQGGWRGRSA